MTDMFFRKMMQFAAVTGLLFFIGSPARLLAQKTYTEGKVVYKIESVQSKQGKKEEGWLQNTSYMMLIKGAQTRTELKTEAGSTVTIHDSKQKTGALINEYGNQKILVRLDATDLEDRNKKYEGMSVTLQSEKKTIAGYECLLALVKLKDGNVFRVFYAPALQFQNNHFDSPFHDLPGYPLEFESESGKVIYRYVAQQVEFSAVPGFLFDIPKTGYKEMSYAEVKAMQGN